MKIQNPKSRPKPTAPQTCACGTCRHFKPTSDEGGDCRRYPPIALIKPDATIVSAFPGVRKADIWCGEYRAPAKT